MPRDRDLIWDTVCDKFGLDPKTKTECTRIGKVVSGLKTKIANEASIRVNCDKWGFLFPGATLTPEALVKHWDQLCSFATKPNFPGMPEKKIFDVDQQMRCLDLHGEEFLRQRCQNEGFECILDKSLKTS